MTLSLNNIKTNKTKRRRVGRGNSSGSGNYSGKGMKGQKCRSGVSGLKRLGMRQMLLATPKVRGFKSARPKNQVVKVESINKNFKNGEKVDPKTLAKKGLVDKTDSPIKILGKEELKVKVEFENVKLSKSVIGQIKK
ncbi:50S ribosomal protein L15 [Candidatus Falkowbacteria bacterium]|nr:50S ribosomal protein L15 [Candidatus Falkowbacteria bacterium]